MKQKLTYTGIGSMHDNKVADLVDAALGNAFADCEERPEVCGFRTVVVKFRLSNKKDKKNDKVDTHLSVEVQDLKLPADTTGDLQVGRKFGEAGVSVYESDEDPSFLGRSGKVDPKFDGPNSDPGAHDQGDDDDFPETGTSKGAKGGKSAGKSKARKTTPKKPADPKGANATA